MPPPHPKWFFYICLCACLLVRSLVCTGAHTHTHTHRHARVLCVNSLRSRLFICEKTGAINPPADFGRSPERGPGGEVSAARRGMLLALQKGCPGTLVPLPASGVCPSLGGQGGCYAARSNLGFKKRSAVCDAGTLRGPGEAAGGRGASLLLKNTSSP